MAGREKIFLASDLHLGAPNAEDSLRREKHFVNWLEQIRPEAKEVILLGDLFDFWFEYRHAVPKGFLRVQGKLAELADAGVKVTLFVGNHDLWMKDYFPKEIGAEVHKKPILRKMHGKTFYLAHGDGLGPGDHGYKFYRRLFTNPVCKWLFHWLHPNIGIGLARFLSRRSRRKTGHKDAVDHGEKEFLLIHARKTLKEQPEIDYFVFGHRHLPKQTEIADGKFYINIGDWIQHFSYLEVGPEGVALRHYPLDAVPDGQPAAGADQP